MEMAPVAPKRIRDHIVQLLDRGRFRLAPRISPKRKQGEILLAERFWHEGRLPNDFFGIENRALGAGSLVIPLTIRLLDLGDTSKANPDSTGHGGF